MNQSYILNYCNLLNKIDTSIINSSTNDNGICKHIFYYYFVFTLWYGVTLLIIGKSLYNIYNIMNVSSNETVLKHRCIESEDDWITTDEDEDECGDKENEDKEETENEDKEETENEESDNEVLCI